MKETRTVKFYPTTTRQIAFSVEFADGLVWNAGRMTQQEAYQALEQLVDAIRKSFPKQEVAPC